MAATEELIASELYTFAWMLLAGLFFAESLLVDTEFEAAGLVSPSR